MDLLAISIGVGLVVSFIFSELFGLAAGGLVVPGYFALHFKEPLHMLLTLGVGLATFGIVRILSSIIIVYGKRRTIMMVLIGFILGFWLRSLAGVHWVSGGFHEVDLSVIGYIIPGLIAIWLDRQGVVETICTLATATVLVRLTLIVFLGGDLPS